MTALQKEKQPMKYLLHLAMFLPKEEHPTLLQMYEHGITQI